MARLGETEPISNGSVEPFIPPNPTLPKLREAARICRGCDLWVNATGTVFGEGPSSADVVFVGEAPGHLEDRAGHPFVGPSGKQFRVTGQRGKPMATHHRYCGLLMANVNRRDGSLLPT